MLQQWHKRYTVILVASLFMFASGLVFAAKETPTVPQKENIIKNSQADKAKTDDKAKVKSDDKAKVKSDDKPKVKTADKAKVKSDDKAKVKSDDKAKAKTDEKANVKTADKAKVKSDDKAKAKTADKAKVKSDDKAKVKSDDKAKAKTDDKANVKTVAKKTSPGSPEEKEPSMTRLLRYPHIHGNDVVFVYGGDLWKAPISGGLAARLTASEGLELFPRFSPDGKWIAFTGQYDGDEQVYVIPSEGGIPKQLTWYPIAGPVPPRRGVEHQVLGWTPDSKKVLFRSGRDSNSVDILTNLYTVDLEGGLPEKLPMPVAGAGTISPDGTKVVYSPLYRDFRHWKRYEGGWAQYLLIYDLEKKTYKRIPTTPRTDRDPMWIGSDVYFLSDREGTMKLYRYDADSNKVEKKLGHDAWDMRWATSDNEKRIVYELGGKLFLYDTASKVRREIQIRVPHDGLAMRPSRINVGQWLEEFELSPQGKRALFVARGDVFTVPAEKGLVRNLTNSSNAHDRGAVWSPQGRWIAFISDMEGEDQIYLIDQSGTGKPLRITSTFKNKLDDLRWSPCGTSLSVWDAKDHLYVIDLDLTKADRPKAKNVTTIARELYEGPRHTAWSPSGEYLALVLNVQTGGSVIYIWSRQTGKLIQVTDPIFDSFSPAFAPNGDWLYYIAQREFYPQISTSMEWNFACNRFCGLFAVPLRKDVENIFLAKSDEVEIKDNKAGESKDAKDAKDGTSAKDESKSKSHAKTAKKDDVKKDDAKKDDVKKDDAKTARKAKTGKSDDKSDKKADKPKSEKIDFSNIASRAVRIPVSSENYTSLAAAGDFLYYVKSGAPYYGRESSIKPTLMSFDLKQLKETVCSSDASVFVVSPDGTKLILRQGRNFKLAPVGATVPADAKTVSTSGLFVDRVPAQEWNEVFNEVWRRFRDFFYVGNMHGCDWNAIGKQYRSLLPYVAHRDDLTYVLTEMISELNVGHTYVAGGDAVEPERAPVALPGATFVLDKKTDRYRIGHIYPGQNEEPRYRSPLTEFGVHVAEGEYIFEIDGVELTGSDNPYRLLRNKQNPVTWKVGKKADGSDARTIQYNPVSSESNLRYLDFVLSRRKETERLSGGQVGYLHIPNMGAEGAYEFIKWYYPQLRKSAIVIDVRSNGGGNISAWLIERLNLKLLGTRFGSTSQVPSTYPITACNAHLACLINETSASDGDIFPYYFRKSGLGPLVGKRTWGGVVGISGRGPLIDGGTVFVPLSATNDEKGNYIIEGHGVDPDIVVEQDPVLRAKGRDPQLERGVAELLKKIKEDPRRLPSRPADPVKDKKTVKKY